MAAEDQAPRIWAQPGRAGHATLPSVVLGAAVVSACMSIPHPSASDLRAVPLDSTSVIAVAPVRFVDDAAIPEEHLARIDAELAEALRGAGVSLVPADTYAETWSDLVHASGGVFDPFTGARDDEKYETVHRRFIDHLRMSLGATMILFPEVEMVTASYHGGIASWDGVSRGIPGRNSGFFDFLDKLLDPEGVERGEVLALTLIVAIETLEGEEVAWRRAGIEVADQYERGQWRLRDDLLAQPDLTLEAVRVVVTALFSGAGSQ